MLITVAICTWNRCQLLEKTLEQFTKVRVPDGCSWELLVVDNNSTDRTVEVLERFRGRLPLRSLHETQQGQCHARNKAIAEAKGELLIWTDDDVLVDQSWLVEYAKALSNFPQAHFFGGTIDPWFEEPPPRWILENMDGMRAPLVINRLGDDTRELRPNEYPLGANMAVRMKVMKSYLFDVNIGHCAGRLFGGDDMDLIKRMREDGLCGVWVGMAKVQHFIPKGRLKKEYLLRQAVDTGQLEARQLFLTAKRRLIPRWCIRQWLTSNYEWLCCWMTRSEKWVHCYMKMHRWNAFVREWWRLILYKDTGGSVVNTSSST